MYASLRKFYDRAIHLTILALSGRSVNNMIDGGEVSGGDVIEIKPQSDVSIFVLARLQSSMERSLKCQRITLKSLRRSLKRLCRTTATVVEGENLVKREDVLMIGAASTTNPDFVVRHDVGTV